MLTEARFKSVLLAGLAASSAVAMWLLPSAETGNDWRWWLIWPAMTLHQCEENVFTELALGRKFAFLRWVRKLGYDLTLPHALALNVFVGWTLAILSGLIGPRWIYFPLFVIAVETVNAFWHLSVTSLQQRWSPGTLSSVLITIPLGFALFHGALSGSLITNLSSLALFVAACVSHHLFLGSLPRLAETPLAGDTLH